MQLELLSTDSSMWSKCWQSTAGPKQYSRPQRYKRNTFIVQGKIDIEPSPHETGHYSKQGLTTGNYKNGTVPVIFYASSCAPWPVVVYPCAKVMALFTPQPLRAPGYCRRPSGWAGGRAAGQTSPLNTLTSTIFHGSFWNLARTFIALRSRTS